MKALVIAATTLSLATPLWAQETTAPVTPVESAAETAGEVAKDAAKDAADLAGEAATKAGEAAAAAGDAAKDVAKDAADAAAAAGKNAEEAAKKAATAAGEAADKAATDAAKATDQAVDSAKEAATAAETAVKDAATKAEEGAKSAETAATAEGVVIAAPDVSAPAISESEPGILSSWMTSRRIWTTNEPSTTAWDDPTLTERPAGWQDIAKVDDIVLDPEGHLVGYIADIGGFLGIGAKKVLLGRDAIHMVQIGKDRFYATNFTKAELEALPDFNPATVLK